MPDSHAIRRQVELAWEEFWKVGVYDSAEILEQILYLLFLKETACWPAFRRLDDRELFASLSGDVPYAIPTPAALGNIVRLLDALPDPSGPGAVAPFNYVADKLAGMGHERRQDAIIPLGSDPDVRTQNRVRPKGSDPDIQRV